MRFLASSVRCFLSLVVRSSVAALVWSIVGLVVMMLMFRSVPN